jgi:transposase
VQNSSQNTGKINHPERGTLLMNFEFIETVLELPECRVISQVIRPNELELHLERRESYLVCPHCQGCCSRMKEGRDRCLRDLPILDRPVILRVQIRRFECSDGHHRPWEKTQTFGDRIKWTERLDHQVRQEFLHGCPCKELASRYGLSARTVFR